MYRLLTTVRCCYCGVVIAKVKQSIKTERSWQGEIDWREGCRSPKKWLGESGGRNRRDLVRWDEVSYLRVGEGSSERL